MNRPMTDAEAWGEMAEYARNGGLEGGLCLLLKRMLWAQGISHTQEERLRRRLYRKFRNGYMLFWPFGETAPRIRACLALMRESLERDGK